jgi:lysozyme
MSETKKLQKYTSSPLIVQYLADKEGFRDTAYPDQAGIWTIGYGTIEGVKQGDKITKKEAFSRKVEFVRKMDKFLNRLISVDLTQYQYDAIASLTYNIGVSALSGSTLLKLLNKNDFEGASEQFLRWTKYKDPETGKMKDSQGLINRRKEEKQIFDTGAFQNYVWKKASSEGQENLKESVYEKFTERCKKFFWRC